MALYRINLHRLDQEDRSIVRALTMGLDVTMQRAYSYCERLRAGFSVFHEGETLRQMALGIEGLSGDVLAAPPATLTPDEEAIKLVSRAWSAVEEQLQSIAPAALQGLAGPANAEDLAVLERKLGVDVPAQLVAWLSLHDGCSDAGPLPWQVLSIVKIAEAHRSLRDERGSAGSFEVSWVPFASRGVGSFLCLDGESGELRQVGGSSGEHPVLATSLASWLEEVAEGLAQRRLVVTTEGGRFHAVMERERVEGSRSSLTIAGEDEATRQARIRQSLKKDPKTFANELFRKLHLGRHLVLRPGAYPPVTVLPALRDALEGVSDAEELPKAVIEALQRCEDVSSCAVTEEQLREIVERLYLY